MATKLNDYIEEVRSGYDDEQQARLDAEMRRFNLAGQLLALRLAAGLTQAELAERASRSARLRPGRTGRPDRRVGMGKRVAA